MQFNSLTFLFNFLPLFLAVYYIFPVKWRNFILVIGSLIFYGLGCGSNFWWLKLLAALTAVTYMMGIVLQRFRKDFLLGAELLVLFACLIFFKRYNGGALLPVGLSFYLFQMAAYLMDIYRQKISAEMHFIRYAAQCTMFPKLLCGPLMEPAELQEQVRQRRFDGSKFHRGLQELIAGLGMKVLLANRLGGLWSQAAVFGYESISVPFAWMALLAYALRLYFDFFGYSLMGVGVGRMLGFQLPENFLEPYSAKTVGDFYRRWHATLGRWFREYIYIPLGGNRKGMARTLLNLCVVWLLTGLWHGNGGNYLIWAGFLCLMIILERLFMGKILNRSRVFCHVYLVFVILLSWVPFAIGDWNRMRVFLGRLFGVGGIGLNPQDYIVWGQRYLPLLLTGIFFATPIPRRLWGKIRQHPAFDIALFALFWAAVYFIATAAQDPFLYFQY